MLLDVTGLSPRSIEAGDTVEISGEGFPEGKSASVTLEGALFRAGLANLENFHSTFTARVDSPQRLSFVVGAQLEEALSQAEQSTAHATFRGRALVAFAPKLIGAPPVEGELKDLTLEIYSSGAAAVPSKNDAGSASGLLTLLGIAVEQSSGQLHVSGLQAGRAARAGVALGDTVLSANGVSVFSAADLLPGQQERQLTLLVKHADAAAPTRIQISVDGLSAALPGGFTGVFAIALASVLWLFALSWKLPLWQASVATQLSKARKQSSVALWALFVGFVVTGIELRPALQGLRPFVIVIAAALIALLRPLLGFFGVGFAGRTGFKFRAATAAAVKIQ
ncbi:MAG TPA: hypothetical protein VL137_04535, partial [Polyangiaceae bacterium]|nr:hypothetical protein [Polyangiaceae bacterium]